MKTPDLFIFQQDDLFRLNHKKLSIRRQCELLDVNRNRLAPRPAKITVEDELVMRCLDEIHTEIPFYGARKLRRELRDYGWFIGRNPNTTAPQTSIN